MITSHRAAIRSDKSLLGLTTIDFDERRREQMSNDAFDQKLPYSPSYTGLRRIPQGVNPMALEEAFRCHVQACGCRPVSQV